MHTYFYTIMMPSWLYYIEPPVHLTQHMALVSAWHSSTDSTDTRISDCNTNNNNNNCKYYY